MKFTAAGDMLIQQRIHPDYPGFAELGSFIQQADARFFNLETTLNYEGEAPASQFSGGTYLRTDPEVLDDIKPFGFNMTSFNNNHALDYFYDGFECTLNALDESGLVYGGAGRNLDEAAAPRYLDTPNGRVALISVSFSFNPSMMAGQQTGRVKGRPGVNGICLNKHIELPPEEMEQIQKIAAASGINAAKDIGRKEGYQQPLSEGECALGELKFKLGDATRFVMQINKKDMERVEKAIYEAGLQANYILISVHAHQVAGSSKEDVPEFLQEFAHRCIDAGAHAIIGHGPHLLRPIEVYKDCPIFYSLGDFVLQLYSVPFAPEEFYAKYSLGSSATVHELLKKRSKDFTAGLMTDWRMSNSVIPLWETEGTNLKKLVLLPIEMPMEGNKAQWGLPRRSDGKKIFAYLQKMCKPYGTTVEMTEDGLILCQW